MSSHSLFSPSKANMWMECVGALAMPENQQDDTSSTFADDGTASHTLASWCFDNNLDTADYPGEAIRINGRDYTLDDERRTRIQSYVDDVRRSAMGGILWSEHRVDLSRYLGMAVCEACTGTGMVGPHKNSCAMCGGSGEVPQGGTSDAVVILPELETVIVGDLKDGAGERVWASYLDADGVRQPNHQAANYGLGVLEDVLLLGHKITKVILRVYQPRLDHLDKFEMTVDDLLAFGNKVTAAALKNGEAFTVQGPNGIASALDMKGMLNPGTKTCRWCRAIASCPAYIRQITEITRAEFDDESTDPLPIPDSTDALAKSYAKAPLVAQWLKAVTAAVNKAVADGKTVIGPDHLPLKFVEGGLGNRAWDPAKLLSGEVEASLSGQLGPKAYGPPAPLTAPQAANLLDKKATKATWKDVFEPMIKRQKKPPMLAWGSDVRPAVSGNAADASEFESEDIGVE